jgi:L-ornithine Nalpha-acyltransferase
MTILARGRYRAFEARGPGGLRAALALRAEVFPVDRAGADAHDPFCGHMLIEDVSTGEAVCTFRTLPITDGAKVDASYSARFYDLDPLKTLRFPMIELGRFCIRPGRPDADILRVAWGALTRIVGREGAGMVFGCASFGGTAAGGHADAFGLLRARHLAPAGWRPRVKAPRVVRFAEAGQDPIDPRGAMAKMPPLLRTYLPMGGRVSDHAVIDEEMGTLHVFTGLEVAAIPPARLRLLRAVAG